MWMKSYSVVAPGIEPHHVWAIWSDIPNRPAWDIDTEWAKISGSFEKGARFRFKPKGGPALSMTITECIPNKVFTDCFSIPFARLYGIHEMELIPEGLRLTTTIKIEGCLGWIMSKILGEKIVAELPEQTDALIKLASSMK